MFQKGPLRFMCIQISIQVGQAGPGQIKYLLDTGRDSNRMVLENVVENNLILHQFAPELISFTEPL